MHIALTDDDDRAVQARLAWGREQDVLGRLRRRDHTLWAPDPTEIADRLGWLDVHERMRAQVADFKAFADEVRAAGITDCVLLGMGGSSLAPEVMRQAYGCKPEHLTLHVLDSTHPDQVAAVRDAIDVDRTLFLASSKSGGTLEVRSLYAFFRALQPDGAHFAAVTDPGTALEELAAADGFRRVFHGDPEIGGRYSALSQFGLVPAALIGADVDALLDRAASVDWEEAVQLGLTLGELARLGRDKLTLEIDGRVGAFGLWIEQLVAESTGKGGTGILPVVDEPLEAAECYGEDRVFVSIGADTFDDVAAAGHPVIELPLRDTLDLGGQFLTWEIAVAVACAVLGVNAFDQPNVQEAKDLTAQTIDAWTAQGGIPDEPGDSLGALSQLLDEARAGGYVAILAYLPYSPATESELEALRVAETDRRHCATTIGYGPRYLHSTGQLHKGGPRNGSFVVITADAEHDLEVPGAGYGFELLVRAQAAGDLRALRERGLPAVRLHLDGDPADALTKLLEEVG